MGYYSNITIMFYVREHQSGDFPVLKLWVDENYPLVEAKKGWSAVVEENPDAGTIRICYDSVKWYSSYAHPQAVSAALDQFDVTFTGDKGFDDTLYAWESMEIGEEIQDNQHKGSEHNDYRLTLHREAVFF